MAAAHFSPEDGGVTNTDHRNRGIARHRIRTQRSCSLGVVTGGSLERTDHTVRIVDLSVTGVGIESAVQIDPGFVWFKDRVGGHKYGVLTWSRRSGDQYRAGITFVTLSGREEQYIQEQMGQSPAHTPFRDPLQIIRTMIEAVRKDRVGDN